ncbi:hypothetical protein TNCT_338911 [Trichonephila clavata]|uniref:Uncharacterized protein n=1 Tax=Trichonephila clavata TaxID=2740835 RepID=A0A8X6H254_TRICU|nr:hypothetical protein TNCT_338911 [Trichonephila clavata]
MASFLLGKRGVRSKSILPIYMRGEYVWILLSHRVLRGGVGRRDVTLTWAPVIKREGSTFSKGVSGLSVHIEFLRIEQQNKSRARTIECFFRVANGCLGKAPQIPGGHEPSPLPRKDVRGAGHS